MSEYTPKSKRDLPTAKIDAKIAWFHTVEDIQLALIAYRKEGIFNDESTKLFRELERIVEEFTQEAKHKINVDIPASHLSRDEKMLLSGFLRGMLE